MTDSRTCDTPTDNSLPLSQATALIAAAISPSGTTTELAVADALNRVLAADVQAPVAVPPHRNSAMDGYAFKHAKHRADGLSAATVVGQSLAGHPFSGALDDAHAVQVMTGAVVPDGLDTVVVQEAVERTGDTISFDASRIQAGAFLRDAGDDIALGDTVLHAGTRLGAAHLGVLASLGIATATTYRQPRVAVMSTGDELRRAGETLLPGQIYDSNRTTLRALITESHAAALDTGQVPDSPEAIRDALDRASADADVILSSGGVSVGVADHMRAVLESEGTLQFWKIAVKPGRPLVFGRWKGAWYFGLPGNPVSAMVTFDQIVRPALAALEGETPRTAVQLTAVCESTLKKLPGRMEFQRGRLANRDDGVLCVHSTGNQDSHVLTSLSHADCLIALPIDSDGASPGDTVAVVPTNPAWGLAP